jgi:hypothetical protein
MDQIMGKVGGLWFSQNAGKEMNNVGEDINVSPPPSVSPISVNSYGVYEISLVPRLIAR